MKIAQEFSRCFCPLVLVLTSSAALAQASGPRPRFDLATLVSEDDYPPLAEAERREGVVGMQLTIDTTGRVSGCNINKTSGYDDLDAQSCLLLLRRARYLLARDVGGNAIVSTTTQRIRWQLPPPAPAPTYVDSGQYPVSSAVTPMLSPTPPPATFSSKQMTDDMQRNAAELLARKKQKPQ